MRGILYETSMSAARMQKHFRARNAHMSRRSYREWNGIHINDDGVFCNEYNLMYDDVADDGDDGMQIMRSK